MYNAITNPSKINARSPEHNAYGAYISHQFAHFSCCSFWISREMSNKRPEIYLIVRAQTGTTLNSSN